MQNAKGNKFTLVKFSQMSSQQRDEKAQGLSRNNEQSSVKSEEMKVSWGR